ncbi:hypothetical protein ZWY2020_045850 [Hordeum vulgare]|nr:hypothetical protein ZWY2020_045850 [Hordeum vulgare]
MTPDSYLLLRESISTHRTPSPHNAMPPISAAINVRDEAPLHHSSSQHLLQNDAPRREGDKLPSSSDPGRPRSRTGLSGTSSCETATSPSVLSSLGPAIFSWFNVGAVFDYIFEKFFLFEVPDMRCSRSFINTSLTCSACSCSGVIGVIDTEGVAHGTSLLRSFIGAERPDPCRHHPQRPCGVLTTRSSGDEGEEKGEGAPTAVSHTMTCYGTSKETYRTYSKCPGYTVVDFT